MMIRIEDYVCDIPDFPKPGIIFRDVMPLMAAPKAFAYAVEQMADGWEDRVDVVAALEARGFLFGVPIALLLGVPFVPVRKKGKLPGPTIEATYDLEYGSDTIEIQSGRITPDARVLLVDDLLATGGTAAAACSLIQKVGARVVGASFAIELRELGGRTKLPSVPIQSLVTY